jgi:hypothetical protein
MLSYLKITRDLDYCDWTIVGQFWEGEVRLDYASIEIQDHGGNWIAVSKVVNNLQRIGFEMRSVQSRYPDRRVRAVDQTGRLIDLL